MGKKRRKSPEGVGGHRPTGDGRTAPYDAVEDGDTKGYVYLMGVRVLGRTEKALKVLHDGEVFWLPHSVLGQVRHRGAFRDLEVREGFARKEEVI